VAERQAELGGIDGAMDSRAQYPKFRTRSRTARHGVNAAIGVIVGQCILAGGIVQELPEQLDLTGKDVDRPGLRTRLQSARRHLVRTGRPSQTEIDSPGIEHFEHAELFGDLERAVMREHHAARTHAQVSGFLRHAADQDFRTGSGE